MDPNEEAAKAAFKEWQLIEHGRAMPWDDLHEDSKNAWRMVADATVTAWRTSLRESSC